VSKTKIGPSRGISPSESIEFSNALRHHRNSTVTAALGHTHAYLSVFEEVSKSHVHLNAAERLWAVSLLPKPPN
jgi:hypothetical protein